NNTTNNVLLKCNSCQKFLSLNNFIKDTYQHKTCNTCRYNSSLQYKWSNKSNTETDSLTPKEMSRLLYEKILAANANECLENDSMGIDFECELLINTMDGNPKTLSKKIVELI
ncbi:28935_t:CDS:1, partial [Racocetra persica]